VFVQSVAWRRIPNTVRESLSYFKRAEGDASTWGKAVATVDTPTARAFAYRWCLASYEHDEGYTKYQGPGALRKVIYEDDSHTMLFVNLVRFGGVLASRVFATSFSWREEDDGSFLIAWAPVEEHFPPERVAQADEIIKSDAAAALATRATTRGFFHFKALAPSVCKVTYVVQANLGGAIPQAVIAFKTKQTLGSVQEMQAKFERKGMVVDAEMRSAFPLPPPLAELNDEQKLVVESCRAMETEEAWEPLESPHSPVRMWMKHAPPKKEERTIALGKATALIDCPAREATAYTFAYTSRERDRMSREGQHPARILATTYTNHDNVFATIKKMPLLLRNREFVARQVCAADTSGDFLVAADPVDDIIDYGMTIRTVRGIARSLTRITPLGISQCRVTIYQYLDAGGVIPRSLMTSKLPDAMSPVIEMRDEFQRDDEIDKLERDELAATIRDLPQTYTAEEDILINKVHVRLGMLDWELFEELESSDHLVKMGNHFIPGSSSGVGRASVTIDASAEECAAWEMNQMSRENVRNHGSLPRSLTKLNDHSGVFHGVYDFQIPGFRPREFLSALVWRRRGDELTVVYDDAHHTDFQLNPSYVRGTSTVHIVYRSLQPFGGLPHTQMTWTQQVDLGGLIPKSVVNGRVVNRLGFISTARRLFDRSLEIDGATRARHVEMITGQDGAEYSEEENRILAEGERNFTDFQEMKAKALEMASPLTTAKIAYKSGDRHAWGWATTTVRASPEEILAWTLDLHSRSTTREDDLEKSATLTNDHNTLFYVKKRTPKIISDRDFLVHSVWKATYGGFLSVSSPAESDMWPTGGDVVRGKYPSAMRIKRKNDKETTLEYVFQIDFGGSLPAWLTNTYMSSNASYVYEIQEYFQALRRPEEWDADDARAVGEAMCTKTKAEKHPEKGESKQSARMRVLFKKHLSLSEIGRRYEFFEGMMARVVRSTLKPAGDVKSKLCSVSLKEGETIGRGLAMALACNLTAEAAVDEWILKHRSLGELDRAEAWFR